MQIHIDHSVVADPEHLPLQHPEIRTISGSTEQPVALLLLLQLVPSLPVVGIRKVGIRTALVETIIVNYEVSPSSESGTVAGIPIDQMLGLNRDELLLHVQRKDEAPAVGVGHPLSYT